MIRGIQANGEEIRDTCQRISIIVSAFTTKGEAVERLTSQNHNDTNGQVHQPTIEFSVSTTLVHRATKDSWGSQRAQHIQDIGEIHRVGCVCLWGLDAWVGRLLRKLDALRDDEERKEHSVGTMVSIATASALERTQRMTEVCRRLQV